MIFHSNPGPLLLSGDFNAKYVSWNNRTNNSKGKILNDLCVHNNFNIFPPSGPTLIPANGSPSIVDFPIAKGLLCSSPITHNDLSSDHLPIVFNISSDISFNVAKFPNYKEANWTLFRDVLDNSLSQLHLDANEEINQNLIDDRIVTLTNAILSSASQAIPLKKPSSFRYSHSDEVENLRRLRNFTRKSFQDTGDPFLKAQVNSLNKEIKKLTNQLNCQKWTQKVSGLSVQDNSLFQFSRCFKKKKSNIPPLKTSSSVEAFSDKDKAQALAEVFKEAHNLTRTNVSPFEQRVDSAYINVLLSEIDVDSIKFFSLLELKRKIARLKSKKAPGNDKIPNILIKNLSETAKEHLLFIFNSCLKIGYFPKKWKMGKIIPIPKPNKDHSSPKSFRPITLLSSLGKLFERLISIRFIELDSSSSPEILENL